MKKILIALLLLCAGISSAWADPIGRVLLAVGDVSILRQGVSLPLATGAAVESGDLLSTGANSNVQIRFQDESMVALRANSQFRIDDYQFINAEKGGSSIMSLLRGGFRTITGLIGKASREKYEVRTITSTIGIRGTHYNVVSCDGDCRNGDGTLAPNGTYGTVTEGEIVVRNQAGELNVGNDGYFYVASTNTSPVPVLAPPPFLSDRLDGQSRRTIPSADLARAMAPQNVVDQGGIEADGRIGQPEVIAADAPLAIGNQVLAGELLSGTTGQPAILGGGISLLLAYAENSYTNVTADDSADVVGYGLPAAGSPSALRDAFVAQGQSVQSVSLGGGALAYWTYTLPNATPGNTGTYYIFGDSPVSLPGATATYNYVGGPGFTNGVTSASGTWSTSMTVDFTTKSLSSSGTIAFSLGGANYTIGSFSASLNGVTNITGNVSCTGSCSVISYGGVNGGLIGKNAEGLGVGFAIQGVSGNVTGAGVFAR